MFARLPYGPKSLCCMPRDWYRAIGIVRNGLLIAGAVWHDMQANGGDVQLSVVGHGAWCTREVAIIINGMPFLEFGVAHCTARHAASNVRATKIHQRVGWTLEGRQRRAFDGTEDALLFGLTREGAQKWAAR